MRMIFWDVYLNGKVIDSVPYESTCDHAYVKRSLIEHDGYDPRITVRPVKRFKKVTKKGEQR